MFEELGKQFADPFRLYEHMFGGGPPPVDDTRRHRTLAVYCALKCWQENWDGIELSRVFLGTYLGLERIKQERVAWIARDFAPWFPFHCYDAQPYEDGAWDAWITFARRPVSLADQFPRLQMKQTVTEQWIWAAMMPILQGFVEPSAGSGLQRGAAQDAPRPNA